jgi:hypothetical protein
MPIDISFLDPVPLPEGFRIGYRKKGTSDAYVYAEFAGGGSPLTIDEVENYEDYEGTIESVCSGFFSAPVAWATDQYRTTWEVRDIWFDCAGEVCDGPAIFCVTFSVRRESDNALIFGYNFDGVNRIRTGHMPTLVDGVNYILEAEWAADITKTNFDYTFLTGNSTSNAWEEVNGESAIRSIVFMGAADSNHILVQVTSEGALCSCAQSLVSVRMSSFEPGDHCSGPSNNVRVAGSATVLSEGMTLYIDPSLSLPVQGNIYVSDSTGTIRHLDPVTGVVGGETGSVCE